MAAAADAADPTPAEDPPADPTPPPPPPSDPPPPPPVDPPPSTGAYTLLNTGRSGRVYDVAGHSLGGGERITVSGLDAVGQAVCDHHYLYCTKL